MFATMFMRKIGISALHYKSKSQKESLAALQKASTVFSVNKFMIGFLNNGLSVAEKSSSVTANIISLKQASPTLSYPSRFPLANSKSYWFIYLLVISAGLSTKQIAHMDEKRVEDWRLEGRGQANRGNNLGALYAFDKALEINPNSSQSSIEKGMALFNLGCNKEALHIFEEINKINASSFACQYFTGHALYNLKRDEEALQAFNETIKLAPLLLDRADGSFNDVQSISKLMGLVADAWLHKGVVLGRLDQHKEALSAFDKVLEIDSKHLFALINRGMALKNLNRPEEAIQAYDKALETNCESIEALNEKGVLLGQLGRCEEALTTFDKALKIDPQNSMILEEKARLFFGSTQCARKR